MTLSDEAKKEFMEIVEKANPTERINMMDFIMKKQVDEEKRADEGWD